MSGRRQHYIPQSLLRGFGKQGRGKAVQVTVYPREGSVFTTATHGVAARRYFYSKPTYGDELETLDDKVTTFESRLSEILEEFRGVVPNQEVDPTKSAEAVAHLCVRQAHVRDSFASATGQLLRGIATLFQDEKLVRKKLGLDEEVPNEIMKAQIHRMRDQMGTKNNIVDVTGAGFDRRAFDMMKTEFEHIFPDVSSLLEKFAMTLQDQTSKMARDGHIGALEQSLAPDARIEVLEQFAWRVTSGPAEGLVLPDCVVTSWSAESGFQPLFYTGKEFDIVFMPLSYDRLLVGERREIANNAAEITNEVAAACSWDFFVARERVQELQELIPRIGERARQAVNEAVWAALSTVSRD